MAGLPTSIKAWIVTKNGPPKDVLKLRTDWPMPTAPTGSDILVKVSHASVNPSDVFFLGHIPSWLPIRRTPIPGIDFAGEIILTGPSAPPELAVGTEVCGTQGVSQIAFGKGTLVEYIVVPAHAVAVKPQRLGMAQAASLGVGGQTAVLMIQQSNLKKGDRILVNGASGGVGTLFIQMAKARGAFIYGVCSEGNAELVRRLGADEVIDYKAHAPLHTFLAEEYKASPFDYIFDCVGSQELFDTYMGFLKPKGLYINVVGGGSEGNVPFIRNKLLPAFLGGSRRNFQNIGLSPSGKLEKEVVKWVEDGLVKEVLIDSEYAMEDLVQACERVLTKRSKGRVVVKVGN